MWLSVVCCEELLNWANIAIFCLLMLGGKRELVWDFVRKCRVRFVRIYDNDAQPLLLWLAQIKSGSDSRRQLAEQEGTNRWDWTTDENEQTMKMNKQWRCCYDFWEGRVWAALRSCSIRLATQLLVMRWVRFARKDKQIVQKRLTGFHKFW